MPLTLLDLCFHPLKAGRRLFGVDLNDIEFRVSIPSRRVGDDLVAYAYQIKDECFHPLKAGRRPSLQLFFYLLNATFPSPQGGSETQYGLTEEDGKSFVSIPSRRVGDRVYCANIAKFYLVSIPSRRVGD